MNRYTAMTILLTQQVTMDPVLSRRSIRKYTEQQVSDDCLHLLLKAAMAAPSADDERPWHFVVIQNQDVRTNIAEIHPHAYMAIKAPMAILICGDETLQKNQGFWVQDCAAATENILIEAQHLGLGAVWLGIYPIEGRVQGYRKLLKIPELINPFALVAIGYPAEYKTPAERYEKSRIHYDTW